MHLHQELEGFYLGSARTNHSELPPTIGNFHENREHALHALDRDKRSNPSKAQRAVILILEDFDEIRSLLSGYFARRGCEVFSSATLRDALAIAWQETPNIILIDHGLRNDTALHAIAWLHEGFPESRIVLIGANSYEMKNRAIMAGASSVMEPEFTNFDLDRAIETLR